MSNDAKELGFEFPGSFELTAFGVASETLIDTVVTEMVLAGVLPDRDGVTTRASRDGNYLAVRVPFKAETRAEWGEAHARLRRLPSVRWTM